MHEPQNAYEQNETLPLIEGLAERLARRGLAAPSIVALELLKPWIFVGSQILLAAEPLLGPWGAAGRRYATLFEERRHVEALLAALESRRGAPPQAGEERCQPGS